MEPKQPAVAEHLMSEIIYHERGFKNRTEYLMCLARDYGVPYDVVRNLANYLGESEDYDKLVDTLEQWED